MANEFIARNGLIAQNNSTVTGSLTVTGGITGSLLGTASYASQALSSSFATTASYVANASSFPFTGSAIISGSLSVIGPTNMTGSLAISSSQVGNVFSVSASYIDFDFDSFLFSGSTTFQGSIVSTAPTASFTALSATTASLTGSLLGTASFATTASFALNAASGGGFPFTGSAVITGSLAVIGRSRVTGSVTAANTESLVFVNQSITQTNATGSAAYQVSINPLFTNTAPNQTQTALRINATFTGSQSGSNTQNLIADFGAANVGSQFTVNDVTSGSIYMVNDVSGLPIIEATSNWDVNIYDFPNVVFRKTGSAIILSSSFTVVTGSGVEFQVTNTGVKIGNASTDTHQVTGSLNITGSVTSTSGFTGSLLGTASFATTASFALNAGGGGFPFTGSAIVTGSLIVTGSVSSTGGFTGSLQGTASNAISSSFASNGGVTQILAGNNITISPTNGLGAVTINAGITGSNVTASFSNLATWNFNHALNNRNVVIQTYDSSYNQIIPQNINLVDNNNATITFPTSESGFAIASLGGTTVSASYAATASYIDGSDWIDYSATSTVVGWSSYTIKKIYYRIVGKQLFVRWYLEGTSNSTSTSFTLPNNNINMAQVTSAYCVNNGAAILGNCFIVENSNICQGLNGGGNPWTASGIKAFSGNLFIQIA